MKYKSYALYFFYQRWREYSHLLGGGSSNYVFSNNKLDKIFKICYNIIHKLNKILNKICV